ncbi:uncharacterized protein LOC120067591 [Benincasa hispida]|uniref:uncharacterized protein LOC120067591 n=1 Tax=Benincasa hispida TaxID=102211 RepID=UPI0019009B06|nr:uncharacterized protein LOC120067591 [Benincasa hispida]
MVTEGVVLGHKVSKVGLEVNDAKIDVITKLPLPANVKALRSFLGHAGFYRRGHFGGQRIAAKVLQSFFPTLFKDVREYILKCDPCQRTENISSKDVMPLNNILEVEFFDVEAVACAKNDGPIVLKFLTKNIFTHFGTPRALVSDEGTHFINRIISKLLAKYNARHRIATAYHLQTNCQAEVSNREIKVILEKVVNASWKDWAQRLDEGLWVYRTAYKTPIDMSPYSLVFGKTCHLPLELEYKAFLVVKKLNLDLEATGKQRKLQLNELDEWRLNAIRK